MTCDHLTYCSGEHAEFRAMFQRAIAAEESEQKLRKALTEIAAMSCHSHGRNTMACMCPSCRASDAIAGDGL